MRLACLWISILGVSGCSSPADVEDMVYTVPENQRVTSSSKYYQNIVVEKVTGGSDTEFYHDAKIRDDHFKKAVEASLESANLLSSSSKAAYYLTAELQELQQQSFGERPNTGIQVKFILRNHKTGNNVFADTYQSNAAATNKDAVRRGKKVEIATERAAQGVIHKLMDRLLM